ncbi:MAG: hypothetical protein AAF824_16765 [Bacteroidota bacterium]
MASHSMESDNCDFFIGGERKGYGTRKVQKSGILQFHQLQLLLSKVYNSFFEAKDLAFIEDPLPL